MATRGVSKAGDTGGFEESDRGLRRTISTTQLLLIGVSAQVGSGWLFGVLSAAGIAGPAAILSWIIAAVLFGFIALAWMELATAMPRSGGIVRYPQITHGKFTGWIVGWVYWLSVVTIPASEAEAVLTYLGGRFPETGFITTDSGVTLLTWPNGILAGIGLMLLFFVLNIFGIKLMAESNRWVTLWKLLIPTITFCFLFVVFNGSNFGAVGDGGFAPFGTSGIFQAIAVSGIAFSYIGFRQALDFGGEVRKPQRAIPIATIGSLLIPMVLYTLLQVGFLGSIDWADMGLDPGQWSALEGSSWASGPFFHALDAAGFAAFVAFANVLLADAAISPTGTGWVYLGSTIRVGYSLGVQRLIPRVFRKINRFGVPWPAALAALVVGCFFFLPLPSWYRLISFVSAAAVLTYVMGGVGVPVLRRTAPGLKRSFRLPAVGLWAPIGYIAAMLVVYWAGYATLVNLLAAMFIGLPVFAAYAAWQAGWLKLWSGVALAVVFLGVWIFINERGGWILSASGDQRPGSWSFGVYDAAFSAAVLIFCAVLWLLCDKVGRQHVASGAWLVVLLLATLPLSYFGGFGPLDDPVLPFPFGTLVEAALALLTYYWGVASGFETDEIRDIVERQQEDQPTT